MVPEPRPFLARDREYRRIVVLTGAGVSASSGLPTYRGPGGLWANNPELAAALVAGAPPSLVWGTLGPLRAAVGAAAPSPAHLALARFEEQVAGAGTAFTLITQNVDGVHGRAGSKQVIELHGALLRTRCTVCDLAPFVDSVPHTEPPSCPACGAPLRPDVVLFEEPLGAREEVEAKRALRDCDLFVAIGTSGTVWPASSYVRSAEYEGAHTVFVNLTPLAPPNAAFRESVLGPADQVVPALFGATGKSPAEP